MDVLKFLVSAVASDWLLKFGLPVVGAGITAALGFVVNLPGWIILLLAVGVLLLGLWLMGNLGSSLATRIRNRLPDGTGPTKPDRYGGTGQQVSVGHVEYMAMIYLGGRDISSPITSTPAGDG